jgi:hypothetical protein
VATRREVFSRSEAGALSHYALKYFWRVAGRSRTMIVSLAAGQSPQFIDRN